MLSRTLTVDACLPTVGAVNAASVETPASRRARAAAAGARAAILVLIGGGRPPGTALHKPPETQGSMDMADGAAEPVATATWAALERESQLSFLEDDHAGALPAVRS
jgi:hypothetical protein